MKETCPVKDGHVSFLHNVCIQWKFSCLYHCDRINAGLCSTAALECITFGVTGSLSIGTIYLDRGSCAFAVVIIGTVVCFTVNLDFFAAASVGEAVGHGISDTFLETSTACLIGIGSIFTGYIDLTFGAELIFVVDTLNCWTFKNCHSDILLKNILNRFRK